MEKEQSFDEIKIGLEKMREVCPEIVKNFGTMFVAATKSGVISNKYKELICLGISLAQRCEGCISTHVQKCFAAGCTREEMLETAFVSVVMQGGPAYMQIPLLIKALDSLEAR